jgi:hypothetical protein
MGTINPSLISISSPISSMMGLINPSVLLFFKYCWMEHAFQSLGAGLASALNIAHMDGCEIPAAPLETRRESTVLKKQQIFDAMADHWAVPNFTSKLLAMTTILDTVTDDHRTVGISLAPRASPAAGGKKGVSLAPRASPAAGDTRGTWCTGSQYFVAVSKPPPPPSILHTKHPTAGNLNTSFLGARSPSLLLFFSRLSLTTAVELVVGFH